MSDFYFTPERCRNIMVDLRYVMWVVDVYAGADRPDSRDKIQQVKRVGVRALNPTFAPSFSTLKYRPMSVLVNKDSKVIVQGFTGKEGSFHAEQMMAYGTNVVGGVTPGKGGQMHLDRPVFNTVKDAVDATGADVSILFVPPAFAADSVMEAADAGIKVIVCITEGIPVADMVKAKPYAVSKGATLIGPNCPGVITADEAKVGLCLVSFSKKGNIGIVSKSGTLTYEAVAMLTEVGLGQSSAVGIGGDPINGLKHIDVMKAFNDDPTPTP